MKAAYARNASRRDHHVRPIGSDDARLSREDAARVLPGRGTDRARAGTRGEGIDNVVVRSWPETVRLDDDGPHREVVGEVRRFEAWADRRGGSVLPPFETRTRSSIVEDEGVDVLVTPVLCLALYRGERLVAVFPHSADGETYTVERAIDRLEAGELPRPLCGNPVSPDAGSCPDCGTATLNGQGVSVGPDCAWTGSLSAEGWSELETSEEVGGGEANAPRASDG